MDGVPKNQCNYEVFTTETENTDHICAVPPLFLTEVTTIHSQSDTKMMMGLVVITNSVDGLFLFLKQVTIQQNDTAYC